ncbi:hypothetical protein D3C80_865170 [compost metagenome]
MGTNDVAHPRIKTLMGNEAADKDAVQERQRLRRQKEYQAEKGSLKPTCGDCAGFESVSLIPGKEMPCNRQGVGAFSKTCRRYIPETGFLQETKRDIILKQVENSDEEIEIDEDDKSLDEPVFPATAISDLGALIGIMSDRSLRAFGLLLVNEKKTRDQGFRFMQKVFVRYRGQRNRNYVSNFLEAYVYYATPRIFKLISADGRCVMTYDVGCRPVIYTETEFEPMYEGMLERGALLDPDTVSLISNRWRCVEEHELGLSGMIDKIAVSTIDDVFSANNIRKDSKKKELPNLVTLVSALAEGYQNVDKESRIYDKEVKRNRGESEKAPRRSSAVRVLTVRGDEEGEE